MRSSSPPSPPRSPSDGPGFFEAAPYGFYRSTLDGHLVQVNAALVAMLGYATMDELLAIDIAVELFADPADRARLVARTLARDRGSSPWIIVETVWRRRDGTTFPVRLSGRPMQDAERRLAGFQMMAEDLTERRQLEQQLRQAQKMEAVGQLTAGIAHDFNNLLTIILSNTALLREALPPGCDRLREDLDDIHGAAQRGTDMVRKLSAFGRNEPIALQPIDLVAVVADTTRVLQRVLPASIAIRTGLPDQPLPVRGDPGAIEQILLNLATNARDAMPDGGHLEIGVRQRLITDEDRGVHPWVEGGEFACVTVGDTGRGMDPAVRARIFEPFFTTKPRGVGTGLGMAMVYGLVKQHGGYVHLYSEAGRGTVFRIFFPLREAGASLGAKFVQSINADLPGGTETILLVEDEPDLLSTARRILAGRGYRVLGASDGVRALELLREHRGRISLVIADLVMPRLGGRQLHRIARSEGDRVGFLLTSGYTGIDAERGSLTEDAIPFLQKPWTIEELLRRVRAALDVGGGPVTVPAPDPSRPSPSPSQEPLDADPGL